VDPGQPKVQGAPLKSRFRHYLNLGSMHDRLSALIDDFSWGRMDDIFLAATLAGETGGRPGGRT
jgi:hypothetical protein